MRTSYRRLCYAFLIRAILEPIVPPVAASLGCSRGVLAPVSGQFPLPSFSGRCHRVPQRREGSPETQRASPQM